MKQYTCPECGGKKKIDNEECYFCYGTGIASEDNDFEYMWEKEL